MRISDWSSDVCSSDLADDRPPEVDLDDRTAVRFQAPQRRVGEQPGHDREAGTAEDFPAECRDGRHRARTERDGAGEQAPAEPEDQEDGSGAVQRCADQTQAPVDERGNRSEEHPSELQSLMRISYDVVCFIKTTTRNK